MRSQHIALSVLCLLVVFTALGLGATAATAQQADNNTTTNGSGTDNPFPTNNTTNKSQTEIGYWEGVYHNESFEFDNDASAYLDDDDIEKLTKRTIARIEVLRQSTFESRPPVEIVTRTQYQQSSSGYQPRDGEYRTWNNEVWNALFMIENDENVEAELRQLYNGRVRAFYTPSEDTMYVVVGGNSTELVKFNSTSLAHELVHAYQDQKYDLSSPRFSMTTQDGSLAKDSLIEGTAVYIEQKYYERCRTTSWSCYMPANGESTTGGSDVHMGLQMTSYFPYSDGGAYVKHLVEEDGWSAVQEKYLTVPTHTSEIIHYNKSFTPQPVRIDDNSTHSWDQFHFGDDGSERVGEASLAVMFWYQNYEYDINTGITTDEFTSTTDISRYDYKHTITDGLLGDRLLPYHYETNASRTGYVFKTEWNTSTERVKFGTAYESMLQGHGGEKHNTSLNGTVYVLPEENGYSGVYYLTEDTYTVTITHAGSLEAIREIRGLSGSEEVVEQENQGIIESIVSSISLLDVLLLFGATSVFGAYFVYFAFFKDLR